MKNTIAKHLNNYFAVIMLLMIFSTFFVYKNKELNINNFIKNSQDHIVVIEKINEQEKRNLTHRLRSLTHQDVTIQEENGRFFVKIKCPPEKVGFFLRLITENYENVEIKNEN